MGGVRQQFSTAAEVELARESIAFFEELGEPYFHQVGYLFLATTEAGLAALERADRAAGAARRRRSSGSIRRSSTGSRSTTCSARRSAPKDGVADPPAVTRELVRRAAELGVEVRAQTGAAELAPRGGHRS